MDFTEKILDILLVIILCDLHKYRKSVIYKVYCFNEHHNIRFRMLYEEK